MAAISEFEVRKKLAILLETVGLGATERQIRQKLADQLGQNVVTFRDVIKVLR